MHRPDLFRSACQSLKDGLETITEIVNRKEYISEYFDFPSLGKFDSGFPQFSTTGILTSSERAPKNYAETLAPSNGKPARWPDSWMHFRELAISDARFANYFKLLNSEITKEDEVITASNYFRRPEMIDWWRDLHTRHHLGHLLDRYIHLKKSLEFDEGFFRPIYEQFEMSIFNSELPIEIWIPIVCHHFDFEEIELAPDASLSRISEGMQLARCKARDHRISHNATVAGAATHALVLRGWTIPNENNEKMRSIVFDLQAFKDPIQRAERYLASLRIKTGKPFGYSQILIVPIGWAEAWKAHLPPVYVFVTRRYQDGLENYGWLKAQEQISIEDIEGVHMIIKALTECTESSMEIAERRLNRALLRDTELDSILDITIGLEALLVGDSHSEITHKLALRLAALSRLENHTRYTAIELFQACKKIYAFRSAVVHGSAKLEKSRVVQIAKAESVPAVDVGLDLMRYALRVLALNKDYRDPAKLDSLLLDESVFGTPIV